MESWRPRGTRRRGSGVHLPPSPSLAQWAPLCLPPPPGLPLCRFVSVSACLCLIPPLPPAALSPPLGLSLVSSPLSVSLCPLPPLSLSSPPLPSRSLSLSTVSALCLSLTHCLSSWKLPLLGQQASSCCRLLPLAFPAAICPTKGPPPRPTRVTRLVCPAVPSEAHRGVRKAVGRKSAATFFTK